MSAASSSWDEITSKGESPSTSFEYYDMTLKFVTLWSGEIKDRSSNKLDRKDDLPIDVVRKTRVSSFDDDSLIRGVGDAYSSPRADDLYRAFIELCLSVRRAAGLEELGRRDLTDNELQLRVFRKYQLFRDSEGSGQIFVTMMPTADANLFFKLGVYRSKEKPVLLYSAKVKDVQYDGAPSATGATSATGAIRFNVVDEVKRNYDLDNHVLLSRIMTTRPKKTRETTTKTRSAMYATVDVVKPDGDEKALVSKYTAYLKVTYDSSQSFRNLGRRWEAGAMPDEL
jgi:hypothetical protein